MTLLNEYGVTPGVFQQASYGSGREGDLCLQVLRSGLLGYGLVRDLWGGEWSRGMLGERRNGLHLRGKELLKKLITQNRLRRFDAKGALQPATESEWCREALATHEHEQLARIITTEATARDLGEEAVVCAITRLALAEQWGGRACSVRVNRSIEGYREQLRLVLRHARWICVIDPYLDPMSDNYAGFADLLIALAERDECPQIDIHRRLRPNRDDERIVPSPCAYWQGRFAEGLQRLPEVVRAQTRIYVWSDFHDRYLLTDLIGMQLANGLDVGRKAQKTTWSRLARRDAEEVTREFDAASNTRRLHAQFRLS